MRKRFFGISLISIAAFFIASVFLTPHAYSWPWDKKPKEEPEKQEAAPLPAPKPLTKNVLEELPQDEPQSDLPVGLASLDEGIAGEDFEATEEAEESQPEDGKVTAKTEEPTVKEYTKEEMEKAGIPTPIPATYKPIPKPVYIPLRFPPKPVKIYKPLEAQRIVRAAKQATAAMEAAKAASEAKKESEKEKKNEKEKKKKKKS